MMLGIRMSHKEGVDLYLFSGGKTTRREFPNTESDNVLSAISETVKPKDVEGIVVLQGPGSFTAVRTAVVVANTLGFSLHVPVVGVRLESEEASAEAAFASGIERLTQGESDFPLAPYYDREPNITVPNNK